MKKKKSLAHLLRRGAALISSLLILSLAGCGGSAEHEHGHGGHGHAHHAPHGGALAMLGNHAFQIEIVPDAEQQEIDLYVLDGGAEHFVRVAAEQFKGTAKAGSQEWQLEFRAIESEATGETVGNSSHFSASAPELVGKSEFVIRFERLELPGHVFENVTIPYPEGAH